jgi:F0F1-type ATP synthase gamma subunit
MTRQLINRLNDSQKEVDLMILGDKGRSQMRRQYGQHIVCLATERVMPYNFELASALTMDALASGKVRNLCILSTTLPFVNVCFIQNIHFQ